MFSRKKFPMLFSIIMVLELTMTGPIYGGSMNKLQWKMVWIWAMGNRPESEVVNMAKSLGFNAIQARNKAMINECHKAGIEAFTPIVFSSAPQKFKQILLPEEEERLKNQKNEFYQYGGEPVNKEEIFKDENPWCLDCTEALEYGKKAIDSAIESGYDGIALDGIGYKNYYACFCPISREKQEEFKKKHPELSARQALYKYSEESIVSFCTTLINYIKEKNPNIKTTIHIYPHFAPNPFYGNRIPLDYCGQTVSWFFLPHWPFDKVEKYAYEIVKNESKFHKNSIGAPFIGIYSLKPYESHKKSAQRVRDEIRIIKKAGARAIQIAELGNILNDPEVVKVVTEELGGQE